MSFVCNLENIDISYDEYFDNDLKLKWFPWVGKGFNKSEKRTMILGESTYNWASLHDIKDRKKVEERINNNNHLRVMHQNHALYYERKSKYVRNIERAVFFKKNPDLEQKKSLWSSVAYHNLVLRPMKTVKHRPTYDDYFKGWRIFIELARIMCLDQCVVYGLEKNKINSLIEALDDYGINFSRHKFKDNIGRSHPSRFVFNLDGREIKLIFIRHPSAYFSWKKWGAFLKDEIVLK